MRKFCKDCKWGRHAGWRETEVSPFEWYCHHPEALHEVDGRPGRCEVQRNPRALVATGAFCGVKGAWWEPKDE